MKHTRWETVMGSGQKQNSTHTCNIAIVGSILPSRGVLASNGEGRVLHVAAAGCRGAVGDAVAVGRHGRRRHRHRVLDDARRPHLGGVVLVAGAPGHCLGPSLLLAVGHLVVDVRRVSRGRHKLAESVHRLQLLVIHAHPAVDDHKLGHTVALHALENGQECEIAPPSEIHNKRLKMWILGRG